MHMIRAQLCFYYFYALYLAQLSQYYSDILSDISINCPPPIFRSKYYVILASPP